MFRKHILPTAGGIIAMVLVLGAFPRHWLDQLGASDLVKGIVVVAVAIGVAGIVSKFLKPKT